jgi:secreted trypsin-like serine protease
MVPAPASAITYGDFVDSPHIQYPEVVPVWVAGALCTGTLIEQQIVLTAAHCVYGRSGPIQIAVGGSTLNSGRLIDVTATWYHPRYDASFLQNDIGLLHLKEPAGVSRLASLPSPRASKPKNLTMAGWGDDQNGRLTGNLSVLNLNEQGSAASKAFRGLYNPRTMIGAGRFFPNEALYGGGCEGDSGGPLYKGRNGSTRVLVGVTSWGAEGCVQYKPTIFTWVSYYVPELLTAISQVKNRAIQSPLPTGKATPVGLGPTTTTTTTTTTIRPTTTTSSTTTIRLTTTTLRQVSAPQITSIFTSSSQTSFGGQTYAGISVRWSNDWTVRTTRICGSVTIDGSSVATSVLYSGGGWQDSGGGCQTPEPSRDGKGPEATVFYVVNPSGTQSVVASFTVTDELGRTSSMSQTLSF